MWNVMRAQLFQLKREKLVLIVFLIILFMQFTALMGEVDSGSIAGGDYVAVAGTYISLLPMVFVTVLVGTICGMDFMDKTTNYELMAGHTRRDVYAGRAVLSIVGGLIGGAILTAFPVVIATSLWGWGTKISMGGFLLRSLLLLLPIFRIICEFIFFTYLVKNAYITMACGLFVFLIGQALPMYLSDPDSVLLGITNLNLLYSFDAWSTYSVVDVSTYVVYDSALSVSAVISTVTASVIIGAVFLVLGYTYFKHDDLN